MKSTRLMFGILFLLSFFFESNISYALPPQTIGYQGFLSQDGDAENGTFTIDFEIYDASILGTLLWSETQIVNVSNGFFSVSLGSVNPLPDEVDFSDPYYLALTVSGSLLSPRQIIDAVPVSYISYGVPSTSVAPTDPVDGSLYYDPTASGNLFVYDESLASWGTLTTNALSSSLASGAIYIGDGTNIADAQFISGDATLSNAGVLTLNTDSVALTTDTTGNYVQSISDAGSGDLVILNGATEGGLATIDIVDDSLDATEISDIISLDSILVFSQSAGESVIFQSNQNPTTDLLIVSNDGFPVTSGTTKGFTLDFNASNSSSSALFISPSFDGGATEGLEYNIISTEGFSPTNPSGNDVVNGINLGSMTDPGATITSNAISIEEGWDSDIVLNDTTPEIRLSATDNSSILRIIDSALTPNTLLQIQDISTNFGASVEAGAFFDYNSMYSDEFFRDRTSVVADGNQNWGDNTEWSTGETGTCTWDGVADNINGITSILASVAGSTCTLAHTDLATTTPNLWLDVDNLPMIAMKVQPTVAGAGVPDANHQFFAGMYDGAFAAAPVVGAPTGSGIYFTNASDTAGTTGTATWHAVTKSGGVATVNSCGATISETAYALLVIKVFSSTEVRFYIDEDVSNGVSLSLCATHTTNITTNGQTAFLKTDFDAASVNSSAFNIDYYRVWQDDADPISQSQIKTEKEKIKEYLFSYNEELFTGNDLIDQINNTSSEDVFDNMAGKISSSADLVVDFVAGQIQAIRGYFGTLFAKEAHFEILCIGEYGNETCIDKNDLDQFLESKNIENISNFPIPEEEVIVEDIEEILEDESIEILESINEVEEDQKELLQEEIKNEVSKTQDTRVSE